MNIFETILKILSLLPLSAGMFTFGLCAVFFSFFLPKRWKIALKNLKIAFPLRSRWWRFRICLYHFYHLGKMVFFTLKTWKYGERMLQFVKFEGEEIYLSARERTLSGVILLTAHVGNWEVAGFAHSVKFNSIVTVGRPVRNKKMEKWLFNYRRKMKMRQVPFHRSFYVLSQSIKQGMDVAILPDHNTPYEKAVFVDFFGMPASYPRSPFLLMRRTSAPVICAFSYMRGKKLVVEYVAEISGVKDEKIFFELYSRALESYLRRHPEQYLWLHDRWKNQPVEEKK